MASLCEKCLPIFQEHHELPPDSKEPFKFGYGKFKLYEEASQLLAAAESGCVLCLRIRNQVKRQWWKRLAEDQKLHLSISKSAFLNIEYSLTLIKGLHIEIKLTGALAYQKSYQNRRLSLLVVPKADIQTSASQEDLGARTDSINAWTKASIWLTKCSQHTICSQILTEASFQPTRLLFIGEESPARLCHTARLPTVRYASLSHRWGNVEILRLLTSNIGKLEQELPLEELPKTFIDAMEFTRNIGLEYIWIDSLCIIQDDAEDWRREAARMGDVYRYSWINIAATGFEDSTYGMLVDRDSRVVSPISIKRKQAYKSVLPFAIQVMPTAGGPTFDPPFKIRSHAREHARRQQIFPDGEYICFDEGFWERGITAAPLSSRGWVFQERLLSPRTLHFGAEQLFWECRETEACEAFPDGLPKDFHATTTYKSRRTADAFAKEESSQQVLNTWNSILASYTATSLTKQSDRLPALSGIAKDVQNKLNSKYLAGLWEKFVPYQLLWRLEDPDKAGTQTSGAPSWSWASTAGTVIGSPLAPTSQLSECLVASVVDAQVESLTDEMGQVSAGTIAITGVLIRLFPTPKRFDWREYPQKLEDTLGPMLFFWPYGTREYTRYSAEVEGKQKGVEIDPDIYLDSLPWPEESYLLPIINHLDCIQGLVIAPINTDLTGPWRRCGMFEFLNEEKGIKTFSSLIQELIKINDTRTVYLT